MRRSGTTSKYSASKRDSEPSANFPMTRSRPPTRTSISRTTQFHLSCGPLNQRAFAFGSVHARNIAAGS